MTHYEQLIGEFGKNRGEFFGRYDYGRHKNLEYYHQATPPIYHIAKYVGPKVALFQASNDALVNEKDFSVLFSDLSRAPGGSPIVFNQTYKAFSHLTWLVGNGETWSWFGDLVRLLAAHAPGVH